jgi:hypothetical protein
MRYIFIFISIELCVFSGSMCLAEKPANDINIVFRGDKVDMIVEDVALDKILNSFKEAKGISYQGDKSILELKLTGKLKDVSVDEALKRILFHFDHAIIYNKNKQVMGIRITGKGESKDIQINEGASVEFYEAGAMEGEPMFETFQVKRDCGPPHGPITYAPGEKEHFVPEYNVPPPGGLPEKPAITNDEIRENVPPPGGLPPEMKKP